MASRLFQGLVLQIKEATGKTVGVIDNDGTIIACSDLRKMGEVMEEAAYELESGKNTFSDENYSYKTLSMHGMKLEYAVFAEGTDELARNTAAVAAVSLSGLKQYYDEKYDKATFVKNIILDNILPGDLYARAKELHFIGDVPRVVLLIRTVGRAESSVINIVSSIFPEKNKDFVFAVNENDVAVVKEIKPTTDTKELLKLAKALEETIYTEALVRVVIGIGKNAYQLKDVADSYKEAQTAIDVGTVFETDKSIIHYENLGIGRLIYQLPTTLCTMFLSEVFRKGSIEMLDQETLLTIQKFFENNLNVSETSRKLFVHRNTLVYRLEKIKKITGLDLREFDHAIIFKVALMVKKYLNSRGIYDIYDKK